MIDRAFPKGLKPRAYRNIARRDYLRYARNRRPSLKPLRESLRTNNLDTLPAILATWPGLKTT
jgi:hypothetical protein